MSVPNLRPRSRIAGLAFLGLILAATVAIAEDREDRLIADFESEDYGGWIASGTAFGSGPARGALPGQMAVEGFQGRGLVNSFHGGDQATGTLTSPPFEIQRPFLNFLIGGGKFPGKTCLDLIVDGATARTATGPNDKPGGSERLDWSSWDVSELVGKTAVLRVVDEGKGGWGHINVDQIIQSDRKRANEPANREFVVESRYLHLPVKNDAPVRRVRFEVGGRTVREFDIKLADGHEDFRVFADVSPFAGSRLRIDATLPAGSKGLDRIAQSDQLPDADGLYREKDRPQFHFTSRRGWLNDPNGLVWHEGEYHLFYQHNPYGWDWGNMHWGHAVSRDLIHWNELPLALYPKRYGDWCFSGSAVVDQKNTSGFGTSKEPPMVAAFTSTGRGECIVYSNDRGRTWSEFEGNPVVKHRGRDPRLLWHEPSGRWVMAVYDEAEGKKSIVFHSSPDLKSWTAEGRVADFYECPDLFELPVAGEPDRKLWVLYGADGEYLLGRFDGKNFVAETGKQRTWFGNFYAAQTFSDTPDGRRIQVGWGRGIVFPGMPFNQQMTVPCELTLRTTDDGVRMFARPVAELASLRRPKPAPDNTKGDLFVIRDEKAPLDNIKGDLLEIRAEAEVSTSGGFTLTARGVPVVYDAGKKTLSCGNISAPMAAIDGAVKLHILVDRGSIEVFGNDGRVAISHASIPPDKSRMLDASTTGEGTRIRALDVDELSSAWR